MKKLFWTTALVICFTLMLSGIAWAATAPQLDSMEIIGDDGTTYLDTDDFDADDTSYTIDDVDNSVTYLKLYLDYDSDYDVEVLYDDDDEAVTEKSSYWKIEVEPDDLAEITVTVDDGDDEETYTIELASDDSSSGTDELDGLYLNSGSSYSSSSSYKVALLPSFDSEQTSYTALIPYDADLEGEQLNLRISLADDDVDLAVEDTAITLSDDYYDYDFDLPEQGDATTVTVTVEDTDYTLTVYFAAEDANDEAALNDLGMFTKKSSSSSYELDLSPDFDEDEDEYDLTLADDYSKLYLYVPAEDSDMLVFVEDELVSGDFWAFDPDDYDELEITVYAADLDESVSYTINLDDASSTTLTSLYLYGNGSGTISLNPNFSSGTYNYVASVANSINSLYIYTSGSDSVKVSQNGGSYLSKSNTTAYTLTTGLNTFNILVGTDTHYYLNVYRQSTGASIITSTQYISINGGTAQSIAAYNINGNNFVKLRDLAYLLNGTAKQFSVTYNTATKQINLLSGSSYTSVGGELAALSTYKNAMVSPQSVILDGGAISPMAYNIDGYNYFLLRDLAALLDCQVTFSGTTVYLNTGYNYGGDTSSSSSDGDFSDIAMKIVDSESETCLTKGEFDPDEDSYDLEVSEDADYVYLYVYYDDDEYDVSSVKYDGTSFDEEDYSDTYGYGYYQIDIETDDLSDITVKIKGGDGDYQTYTFSLETDDASSDGDFSDIAMKIVDSESKTCLAKSEFDPDEDSYDLEVSEDADYVYFYVYYDVEEYEVDSVEYDGTSFDEEDYSDTYGYGYFEIPLNTSDLESITVELENDDGDSETYTFDLSVDD